MRDIQEEKLKRKKLLKKGLIIVGALLIILVVLLTFLKTLDSNRNKILLNNTEIPINKITYNMGSDTYINLREFAEYFPYQYSTGEYLEQGTVNQDPAYFHLKSPYEVVQFKKESDSFIKYILIDQNYYQYDSKGVKILTEEEKKSNREIFIERQPIDKKIRTKEEYNLSSEVLEINNDQFVPIEDIKYIFNLSYKRNGNTIELYTVDYLEKAYANLLKKSNLHLNPNYQNRRAIIDGYFISTSSLTNPIYGIHIYENGSFRSQISESYKDIRYVQNNKTIFVINKENSLGLINIDKAIDIIKPDEYKSIDSYLPALDLYKVESFSGKFGIIDASGNETKIVVHIEYDAIGYDVTEFTSELTGKIFFDSLIPARKGNRWYIFDLKNPGENYGSQIGGYIDLGYREAEIINRNSNDEIIFSSKQEEELRRRGLLELLTIDRNTTEQERIIKLNRLQKEGYFLNSSLRPKGNSVLTIPEKTGYGGLIVKSALSNGDYVYYLINSDANVRKNQNPYAPLNTAYRRIYKLTEDGTDRYYAVAIDTNDTIYELIKKITNENQQTKENNEN